MAYSSSTLLIFAGAALLAAALVVLCVQWLDMRKRTHVRLKPIALEPHPDRGGAGVLAPEFVVMSGPQAGLRKVNFVGLFPTLKANNALISGYLDPETNEVRSDRQNRVIAWLIGGLSALGSAMVLSGLFG
ncbi:MAG: hypothetical protein AAGF86_02110 [Pseudomonadota bacterium]